MPRYAACWPNGSSFQPNWTFLSLTALATYAGLSVRKLRDHLDDPIRSLPCYQIGGKILVRRSEYDAWAAQFRRRRHVDVDRLVSEVVRELRSPLDERPIE